jgi:RES domain-containing protein
VTRDLGTAWLEKNATVLFEVPSVMVPETVNFLLNPFNKQATKFRIAEVFSYPFDLRQDVGSEAYYANVDALFRVC